MTLFETFLACLALLIVPGPTNTLLALAGAERQAGPGRLVATVLGAYALTVVPLTFLGAGLSHTAPAVMTALRLVACLWVVRLALKLWRLPEPGVPLHRIGWQEVAITTLLNPKALIVGLVILPKAAQPGGAVAVFAAAVALASAVWLGLGRCVLRPDSPCLRRGGGVVLLILAAVVARGAFA
jgi:threonine/homoserine/homoserine lactone efflux protein